MQDRISNKVKKKARRLVDNKVKVFELSPATSFDLTEEEIKLLCQAIKENSSISTILLDCCHNNRFISELSYAISPNNKIESIDINGNYLRRSNVVGVSIARVISNQYNLTEVSLRFNTISDLGFKEIASALVKNNSVTKLDLSNNNISELSASSFSELLLFNNSLTKLDLSFNEISDLGCKSIACSLLINNHILNLNLQYNNIGRLGLECISKTLEENSVLMNLDISNNNLDLYALNIICRTLLVNTSLRVLDISTAEYEKNSGDELGDTGAELIAEVIKTNQMLDTIKMSGWQICDTGAINIASAIIENTTLTRIDLCRNNFGDEGALAIANALEKNYSMIVFLMAYVPITSDAIYQKLEKGLKCNRNGSSKACNETALTIILLWKYTPILENIPLEIIKYILAAANMSATMRGIYRKSSNLYCDKFLYSTNLDRLADDDLEKWRNKVAVKHRPSPTETRWLANTN